MPCCKRNEIRRTCRPQPSFLSRLNCPQCNRVLFFVIGVGLGVVWVRNKDNKGQEPPKDDGGDKKKK
ncbi:uncharacterized protein [Drosophila tropicalis]|uniref:uncharacterized protein n=1 Tax=Drosophila tropicalis TaxID=46794 RepID=UPI0035ABB6D6